MEYRTLGRSGLQVSLVGLGCGQIGGRVDREGAAAIVDQCLESGVTFFDTADIYSAGRSEELVGPLLKPHRHDIVLATKSQGRMGEGPYRAGTSRKHLMNALEGCLTRLQTDYVDLYQMHRWDARTPLEETLRFLDDAVTSGKVRYIGSSNYSAPQAVEAALIAQTESLTPYVSAQNEYNLLERRLERDLVPVCQKYGIGLIPYSPLATGFLTGRYRPGETPAEGSRYFVQANAAERMLTEANFEALLKLEAFAADRGRTMVELAMGWLASQPLVATIIAAVSRAEQVVENAGSAGWRLSADELSEVDTIMGAEQPARR